jgi:hypothetical protein
MKTAANAMHTNSAITFLCHATDRWRGVDDPDRSL